MPVTAAVKSAGEARPSRFEKYSVTSESIPELARTFQQLWDEPQIREWLVREFKRYGSLVVKQMFVWKGYGYSKVQSLSTTILDSMEDGKTTGRTDERYLPISCSGAQLFVLAPPGPRLLASFVV